ncbi:MAG: NAD-dependent epimerase/dehydratase family protein, partial [Chloroflexi bacterium]
MRALVTGGTGFLGNALVRRLLTQGTRVRVLTRSPGKATLLADQGAEPFVGDITDGDVLGRALQDTEIVYHLAGRLFAPGVPADEYYRIHVEGTRVLLACCHKVPGLRRVVHVSTTGVLGVTGPQPADESAPHAPTNAYERTKWQAEVLVGQALEGGLPAVVVRPGLVYG